MSLSGLVVRTFGGYRDWRMLLNTIKGIMVDSTTSYDALSDIIQAEVDNHFGQHIEVSPKALHALASPCWRHTPTDDEMFGKFNEDIVLDRLIASSPYLWSKLQTAGMRQLPPTPTFTNSGYPHGSLLRNLFRQPSAAAIEKSGRLECAVLFRCLLEAAVHGEDGRAYFLTRKICDALGISWADKVAMQRFCNNACALTVETNTQLALTDEAFTLLLEIDESNHARCRPSGTSARFVTSDTDRIVATKENMVIPLTPSSPIISADILDEFNDLINRNTREADYQRFLEHHSEFLQLLGYSTTTPHLVLSSPMTGDLIPDFFLEPEDSAFVDLLEIKRPGVPLVTARSDGRRIRFTCHVREAISQLLEYRRIINDRSNRELFRRRYDADGPAVR
jgi:Domain of unknown function (DUF4263)